ncbi:EAL domain-containing protein [Hasllibacter sp. MH4015]|uniref:EAL domain-containing protein n=1 Tax=Hasllibacter sp. MH4015 TaxID=2854029 RepID=UPI001CD55D92|nr:EAL domain-containing protein [Hasllibacter sp. MH4015]
MTCMRCSEIGRFRFPHKITMAFQPIVDVAARTIFAHEALVRGVDGTGAARLMADLTEDTKYHFDQTCRATAIRLAAQLGVERVSINFMPNAVYDPATCIRKTLDVAERHGYDLGRIIFELTEQEVVRDPEHLKRIVTEYKKRGFMTAIDDFGAGYAGLGLLADLQPDILKLDRSLISQIDTDVTRSAIVQGIAETARRLGITVLAEGIEREEEAHTLHDIGIVLQQGYFYARPQFEAVTTLADIAIPDFKDARTDARPEV